MFFFSQRDKLSPSVFNLKETMGWQREPASILLATGPGIKLEGWTEAVAMAFAAARGEAGAQLRARFLGE